jgi:hypothetical protein
MLYRVSSNGPLKKGQQKNTAQELIVRTSLRIQSGALAILTELLPSVAQYLNLMWQNLQTGHGRSLHIAFNSLSNKYLSFNVVQPISLKSRSINQGCTDVSKIYEPIKNSTRQKGNTKEV